MNQEVDPTVTSTSADDQQMDVNSAVRESINIAKEQLKKRFLAPVKRKIYKVIHQRLVLLEELLANDLAQQGDEGKRIEDRITRVLASFGSNNENALWDIADTLKELLMEIGPSDLVFKALVEEKGRNFKSAHKWSDYFPADDPAKLLKEYEKKPDDAKWDLMARRLASLYGLRNDQGRHDRAREGMRWQYLFWVSTALLLATVMSVWLLIEIEQQLCTSQMLLICTAGSAGAIMSGTLSLRKLASIVELKGVWKTLIPQIFLGASLALIVVLILTTGVVTIGGIDFDSEEIDSRTLFVIGFVSGFSEPFALGILGRIADLGKKEG